MPALPLSKKASEAELYLIAGILQHNAWPLASCYVSPDSFSLPLARQAAAAIAAIDQAGTQPSITTIMEYWHRHNITLSPADLEQFLALAELPVTSSQVEYFAKLVHEAAAQRQYFKLCQELLQQAQQPKLSVAEKLQQHEQAIGQFASNYYIANDWLPANQATQQLLDSLKSTQPAPNTSTYGLLSLDLHTGGLHPGELIYIAARPGVGKTAFAIHLALHNRTIPTAFFTLEMTTQEISCRLLACLSGINSQLIRNGSLQPDQLALLADCQKQLANSPLYINDKPRQSISEIRLHLHRLHRTHNIQLAIIDYLQLIRASIKTYSREQEVAYISASLKATAKELNIPIVCTTQLNRNPEQRRDFKPQLSDLRESGSLEQDADQVILLWPNKNEGAINFNLAKNRHGPTWIGSLKIDYATCRMS